MEPPGTEILDVLTTMLSGQKDDYGKEQVPPLPLSFDRVNEGRPPCSTAPLLNLPSEILGIILEHIASDSLASLALVNRDCLQLARSRQFASVQLDYSISSSKLIEKLIAEGRQTSLTNPASSAPRLGPCIRRITVATNPGWVSYRHGVNLGDGAFQDLPEDEQTRRMVDASTAFFGHYILAILDILNPTVLPHVELLDWEDRICLPQSFFNDLALSPVAHLKLFRVKVDEEYGITFPCHLTTRTWPLRTLHLEIKPSVRQLRKMSTSPLFESILHLCSPTLEDLSLRSTGRRDPYTFKTIHHFPNLRKLSIALVNFDDVSVLEALVHDGLRYLDVGLACWDPIHVAFFERRETIPSLHTFVWHGGPLEPSEPPHKFLRANPQIERLAFSDFVASQVLETEIIPMLSNHFRKLSSLQLVWECTSIPESALEKIAELKTLKQIHLSAGNQFGWKHDWLIDHDSLRRHLCKLPLLEKMAFSRDSYSSQDSWLLGGEHYYAQTDLFSARGEGRAEDWERGHRQRILDEANEYVKVMPKLEWMYFGQIPMEVSTRYRRKKTRRGKVKKRSRRKIVRPLSEERDSCYTLLKKIFGGTAD